MLITNDDIVMSGCKKLDDGSLRIHIYNTTDKDASTSLITNCAEFRFDFTPYEIKSFRINGTEITECELCAY